jgi:integrase
MTPARTKGKGWSYRIEIDWSATLGFRIDRVSETQNVREHNALVALLYELRDNGQIDVLRAFASGDVRVAELKQAKRQGRLKSDGLLVDLKLFQPLWHRDAECPRRRDPSAPHDESCLGAVDLVLPRMGSSDNTRARYATILAKLRRLGADWLPSNARVRDLERVPWDELRARWTSTIRRRKNTARTAEARAEGYVTEERAASAADWNHLARAVSHFLAVLLGDVYHPTRRAIVKRIPRAKEEPRRPRIADVFWRIVDATPEHARPCYVVLGATGMRLGEYLYKGIRLVPEAYAIETTGKTGRKRYQVDPDYWPWVELAVPAPLGMRQIRIHFKHAAATVGRPELRLHDLRHLFAQVAKREGVATTDTQTALGQATPGITRQYEAEDNKADVARAVGRGLTKRRVG